MHVVASRGQLLGLVRAVIDAVPARGSMSFLSSILMKADRAGVELTAAGPEASARALATPDTGLKVATEGRSAFLARQMFDMLRALEDTNLSVVGDALGVAIETPDARYRLASINPEGFPEVPDGTEGIEIAADGQTIARMAHRVTFAAHQDEGQPVLAGVRFRIADGNLSMVATDRHRLARAVTSVDVAPGLDLEALVPARTLDLLNRFVREGLKLEKIVFGDKRMWCSFDRGDLFSQLLEGTYVSVESVMPDGRGPSMEGSREELIAAFRRSVIMSGREHHRVKLTLRAGELRADTVSTELGLSAHEAVSVEYDGDEMSLAYNSSYLVEILDRIDSDRVRFRFSGPDSAVVISGAGEDGSDPTVDEYLCLLMPVRLPE